MIRKAIYSSWPVLLIAAAAVFLLRDPLIFGKSFCIVNVRDYSPWNHGAGPSHALSNQASNDEVFAHYPRKVMYRDSVLSGKFSRWDPKMMGGYPRGADPHNGIYDPFNLLFAIFSVESAFKLLGLLQWLLGGFFAFLFLRDVGSSRIAASLGAVAFFAQPFFITHLAMPTNIQSAIWLPFLMWIFERMMKSRKYFLYVPAAAAGVALSVLGGFPPIFILVISGWLSYCLLRIIFPLPASDTTTQLPRRKALSAVIGAVILGSMFAAPQLLPTFRASLFSERKVIPYEEHKRIAMPFDFLATLANPYVVGRPTDEAWGGFSERLGPVAAEVSPTNFLEDDHYIGWVTLLLALVAVFAKRDRRTLVLAAGAACSLLILYGTPMLKLAYYLIPGFKSSRPDRIVFLWGSFAALLAGIGLDELVKGGKSGRIAARIALFAGAMSIMMAASGAWMRMNRLSIPGRFLPLGDAMGHGAAWKYLALFASSREPMWSADAFMMAYISALSALAVVLVARFRKLAPLLVVMLIVDVGVLSGRFLTFQDGWFPKPDPPGIQFLEKRAADLKIARLGKRLEIFPPNSGSIWGVSDAGGREAILLKHWGKYMDAIEPGVFWRSKKVVALQNPASLNSPLLSAAGIGFIVSDSPIKFGSMKVDTNPAMAATEQFRLVHRGDMYIYRNVLAYPEAWLVLKTKFVSGEDDAAAVLSEGGFDPSAVAVVEGNGEDKTYEGGKITIASRSPEYARVNISPGTAGWLVLARTYYPDWRVEVNGWPRQMFKTDLAFMGVEIKPGDHNAVFKYIDQLHMAGWMFAAAALGACILIWITGLKKSRETG